jgi:hypothetical protein
MRTCNAVSMKRNLLCLATVFLLSTESQALIIIPLPNLGFPPQLSAIRDALENSTDTKALATAAEDKTFGARMWVWGQAAGKMTQADADDQAMRRCEASLANAKRQAAGGQPLYNFGSKRCELYKFENVTLNLPDRVAPPAPAAIQPSEPVVAPIPTVSPDTTSATPAESVTPALPPAVVAPASGGQPFALQQNPANASSDIVRKMRDLETLYRQNLITQDEYERKKKQLLDAM